MQGRQVKRRRLRIKPENIQKKEEGKEEKQGFIFANHKLSQALHRHIVEVHSLKN